MRSSTVLFKEEYASTLITHSEVQPCIAELLRTGYHPPQLILRVERVIEVPIILSSSPSRDATPLFATSCSLLASATNEAEQVPTCRTFRIFLSDGELVIQALLKRELHYFVSTGEVVPGAVLELERYEVRRAKRIFSRDGSGNDKGEDLAQVVFLAVERFRRVNSGGGGGAANTRSFGVIERGVPVVKVKTMEKKRHRDAWDEQDMCELLRLKRAKLPDRDTKLDDEATEVKNLLFMGEIETLRCNDEDLETDLLEDTKLAPSESSFQEEEEEGEEEEAEADQPSSPHNNVLALQIKPSKPQNPPPQNHNPISSSILSPSPTTAKFKTNLSNAPRQPSLPITRPLNLLPIHTLLHPPRPLPKRNYIVDLFAIISWISPTTITRPNMPLKRDLRVIDPSFQFHPYRNQHASNPKLELGLSVSVFVAAEGFCPAVGTIALFRSLKTHEWEGVSLNAYEKDCGGGREWFVSERERLEGWGYDVAGMKKWWEEWSVERERR
ncbi:hypothetical protein PRK78_004926 [Emydomyces testavorans]|uniref:Uncharacterized protein n=1 Tax=Emydomyces testavorans TaxID=2070801 RepID=A0AAF0DKS5_9EURO|nr:hypothetical protein PRK78_004926 [Emydomyces testavorans]